MSALPDPIGETPFVSSSDELSSEIYRIAIDLATEVVDLSGFLAETDSGAHAELERVRKVAAQAQLVLDHVANVQTGVNVVSEEISASRVSAERSLKDVRAMTQHATSLATWVESTDTSLRSIEEEVAKVIDANNSISSIARQVTMLAINARVESARAGDAGRGFSVVASEINRLADQTSAAARTVSTQIQSLSNRVTDLKNEAAQSSETARSIRHGATESDAQLDTIGSALVRASEGLERIDTHASSLRQSSDEFGPLIGGMRETFEGIAKGTNSASDRMHRLVDGSEQIMRIGVELGASVTDRTFIVFIQDKAEEVTSAFENALSSGMITLPDLFDDNYRPVPGTNPQQVVTRFTRLTDQLLPKFLETCFEFDPRVAFCAAIDRNGYLPTHNRKFSQPQSADVDWNTANCRNRRIFDDRVGLKAGRNTDPFLLQVYRRDMGGGNFVLMKDLSAPVFVAGRHWGGVRMGYKMA